FCVLRLPPHPLLPRRPRLHPPQFLLFLLLHAAQQSLEVGLALGLAVAGGGGGLGLLLILGGFVLLAAFGAGAGGVAAGEGDLEVAFGAGVVGAELQRLDVVADCVVEGFRRQRAVAAVEERVRAERRVLHRLGERRRALLALARGDLRGAEVERAARRRRELLRALQPAHRLFVLLLRVRARATRARGMRVGFREPRDGEQQNDDHSAPRFASEPPRSAKNARASGH